jgi:hypothetical protein
VTEIRSFRRVFDLERRIYSVDGMRLNPTGIPVRGVAYLLATILLAAFARETPVLGSLLGVVPWYLCEIVGPGLVATVLALIRIDGRTFHRAAESQLRLAIGPRRLSGLAARSAVGRRLLPTALVMLPDGSDARLRRLRYRGPGAVLVAVDHERAGADEHRGVGRGRGRTLVLRGAAVPATRRARRVIALAEGSELLVEPAGPR